MSKINEISSLKLEYTLYSRYFGKVLVIVGPKSSGKTDIVEKIIPSIPNCYSINRKILAYEAMNKDDKIFLENLLQEATKVTGIKIINGQQLFHKVNVDVSMLSRFSQIKQEFYRIIGTETFKQSYKILLFNSCFGEIKKYIFSRRNIVI